LQRFIEKHRVVCKRQARTIDKIGIDSMNLNHQAINAMTRKARELAMMLFNETQGKFPEITFSSIMPSPELRKRYWIMVTGELSEERQNAMREFVAYRGTDILIDEGYVFCGEAGAYAGDGVKSCFTN